MKIRHAVCLAGVFLGLLLLACTRSEERRSEEEGTEVGKRIVSDASLFPGVNSEGVISLVAFYRQQKGDLSSLSERVNGAQPTIEQITSKYGKPDRVASVGDMSGSYEVHYYGLIGLGAQGGPSQHPVTRIFIGK